MIFSGSYKEKPAGSISRLKRSRSTWARSLHVSHGPMGEKALSTAGNRSIENLREIVLRYLNETLAA